jgi:hypothetical protein
MTRALPVTRTGATRLPVEVREDRGAARGDLVGALASLILQRARAALAARGGQQSRRRAKDPGGATCR